MNKKILIAEIGINHNGDVKIAIELIKKAKLAGFDAVKFQKRTPDICVPENKKNNLKNTPWGLITYLEYKKKQNLVQKNTMKLINFVKKLKQTGLQVHGILRVKYFWKDIN